jgi:Fur family ferric uptake transcriptional regulator/Fur family peroxide stress response transcriptional regulator
MVTNQRQLDEGGLTRQRATILAVVRDSCDHLTANEIYDEARRRLPSISFATVYNSLRYLKDAGLLTEINFGNGSSRYDRETTRHDHALCNRCGKLVDLDLEPPPEMIRTAARRSKFLPESIHFTLRGLCPDCR